MKARFVHTNLVAKDWKRLAQFYVDLFGCEVLQPERDYSGSDLEAGTGIPGVRLRGAHLRLPGYEQDGPTLEIYEYDPSTDNGERQPNCQGFSHIAFAVNDVDAAREAVLSAGGGMIGDVVTMHVDGKGAVTWTYLTDPEGNIVEVQSWST